MDFKFHVGTRTQPTRKSRVAAIVVVAIVIAVGGDGGDGVDDGALLAGPHTCSIVLIITIIILLFWPIQSFNIT